MSRRFDMALHVVPVTLIAAVAAVISFGVTRELTTDHSPSAPEAVCLHAAVKTYPDWPVTDPPVLETIQECKGLPADQRNALRDELAAFVSAVNTRTQGG